MKVKEVIFRYAEATKIGCSWGFASCDGTGHRENEHLPHGSGQAWFSETAGGFVPGRESHCLCLVYLFEPLSSIGLDGSSACFEEHEEVADLKKYRKMF